MQCKNFSFSPIKYFFKSYLICFVSFQWWEYDGPVQPCHLFRADPGAHTDRQRPGPVSEPGERAHQELYHLPRGHLPCGGVGPAVWEVYFQWARGCSGV